MTGQKRCCATCRFFQDSRLSGNGWCTHPKRRLSTDAKMLVRKAELACRDSWGNDLWSDEAIVDPADSTPGIDIVPETPAAAALIAATSGITTGPAPQDDDSFNTAAHLDQEERTAAMRRSPSDALQLAWKRKSGRRSTTPADDTVSTPGEPAFSDIVINPGISRFVAAPVPSSEVPDEHPHESDAKYHDMPEIREDIELPLLRNSFHLNRQAKAEEPPEPAAMSSYDRALEKALEFKRKQQGYPDPASAEHDSPAESGHTFTPPPPVPATPEPEVDDLEDEVVSVRTSTGVSISRFERAPVTFLDDPLDEPVEDDIELERLFQPEPSQQQIGQSWWETVRQKVLGTAPRPEPAAGYDTADDQDDDPWSSGNDSWTDEDSAFDDDVEDAASEWHAFPHAPGSGPVDDHGDQPYRDDMTHDVTAEDHSPAGYDGDLPHSTSILAELPSGTSAHVDRSPLSRSASSIWGSTHEYLDPDNDPDEPLEPMTWQTEAHQEPARVTTNDFDWDRTPSAELGSDFRARLFGEVAEAHTSSIQRPPRQDEPVPQVESSSLPEPEPLTESFPEEVLPVQAAPWPAQAGKRKKSPLEPREVSLAPEIPRECSTCRSFRPTEDGTRGWCMNQAAFGHVRLVNAEDLACRLTMGTWWLPTDEDWDIDGLLLRLAEPTPRTDRLIAALTGTTRRTS